MKFLIFCLVQVLLASDAFSAEVEIEKQGEISFCYMGNVAYLPPKPWPPVAPICGPNEIYACGYGEARCDGLGFCGTPPCHWRCWCKNGYKRNAAGQCVKFCITKIEFVHIDKSPL